MSSGEVWWLDVPGLGRRPGLVLTRDTAIPVLNRLVVAIVTSTVRGVPSEVIVAEEDGLPTRSAVTLDNLYTIPKRRFRTLITRLSEARMIEVCEALRYATAC